ncbi:MAG: Uncharacterized protein LiPW41_422 [Parcubacteria group bacterium LiPW_41]|nr:MAG: Uncharacterized protein LiPW41_422 [Parcubacteria group bacterium LiPW_41]
MEKKIFLEKNDGLEVAVESLIETKSDTVILNVPKDSVLGRSVNNFHVLKREGNTAGKALMIESVDDHILELASLATITAINPVFKKTERAVSDIIPRAAVILKKSTFGLEKKETQTKEEVTKEKEESEVPPSSRTPAVTFYTQPKLSEKANSNFSVEKKVINKTMFIIGGLVSIGVFLFIYLGWFVLPKASIVITMRQKAVQFDETVLVSQNYAKTEVTDSKILLRGQLVSSNGNISLPVSGVKQAEGGATNARGIIKVFNAYGTTPQKLVATTRFQAPDGKIFRTQSDIVVPGGIMVKGVLKPGSINVDVVASEAGDSYNLPPIEKWVIPGFKGTPRYEKFYGTSESAMEGGGSGVTIAVSSSTEGETEETVIEKLRISLEEKKKIVNTVGLKVPEGAVSFVVTKKDLQYSSSSDSLLYVEGTLREIGFSEEDLKSAIFEQTKEEAGEKMRMRVVNISYGTSTPDFSAGSLSMKIKGSIIFEEDIEVDSLKPLILGKKTDEVRSYILSLPWVESAKISFRFPWLSRIPTNPEKVELKLE